MVNVASIFSTLGNPNSLIPLAIKDTASTTGMTVGSYITGKEEGHTVSAVAEAILDGNKTLSGKVELHKVGGDSLKGVEISYMGPTGEKPIELDAKGNFTIPDSKQGYYGKEIS